ncbi:MAG: hypothetical protein PUF62_09855, partial [Bacteroidales bacterium]|nr:hypothetical protein [Bacteroidales bacterium]
ISDTNIPTITIRKSHLARWDFLIVMVGMFVSLMLIYGVCFRPIIRVWMGLLTSLTMFNHS